MKTFILKSILFSLIFWTTIIGFYAMVQAWTNWNGVALQASTDDTLTAEKWNLMVQHTVPPNTVIAYNGATCPDGWSEFTQAQGRVIVWAGSGTDTPTWWQARDPKTMSFVVGQTGGEYIHTLNLAELPSHGSHSRWAWWVTAWWAFAALRDWVQEWGNESHNNIQPYVALRYCVKN